MIVNKSYLENLIEGFVYKNLNKTHYSIIGAQPSKLLTWNRLDLAFKLFYLNNVDKNVSIAEAVYKEDIRSQTLGRFVEYGNELEKNNFQAYLDSFKRTFNSIKNNGFDKNKTLVPLSINDSIVNGSHRIASAIYLNKNISYIKTEETPMIADYKYFSERNVSSTVLDLVVREFIKYSENTYVAFLWPSGKDTEKESELQFSNIVYKKTIKLSPTGGFNLLIELYKHMEWLGKKSTGFKGAKQKLIECFPSFDSFSVIVFQQENIEKVREIKESVRNINNIGFSSIHITDTNEEAVRISNLIFNDNGLHFLNYSNPYKYLNLYKNLEKFKLFIDINNVDNSDILIDGSAVLSLYGLRKNEDIDYLTLYNKIIKEKNPLFDSHDSELKYHRKNKYDLIYDPKYYFQYRGFKFISFNQLFNMKKTRGGEKDINDCNMMRSLIEYNKLFKIKSKLKQHLFYLKIKTLNNIKITVASLLTVTGLYYPVKSLFKICSK